MNSYIPNVREISEPKRERNANLCFGNLLYSNRLISMTMPFNILVAAISNPYKHQSIKMCHQNEKSLCAMYLSYHSAQLSLGFLFYYLSKYKTIKRIEINNLYSYNTKPHFVHFIIVKVLTNVHI